MTLSYQFAAVAGTLEVANEILLAAKHIFGDIIVGNPYSFSDDIEKIDAELFLCFTSRVSELAKSVPVEKILGIEMVPSPHFCVQMATLQSDEKRWVFCNSRSSAGVIVEYCRKYGMPIDRFDYATEDIAEPEFIAILRNAKFVVGVAPLVSPGKIFHQRYGQYLRADCEIFAIDRILAPDSIAAINQWLNRSHIEHKEMAKLMGKDIQRLEQEIAESRKLQRKLEYENSHDILTGFYNRRFFEAAVEQLDNDRYFPIAVIVIDLDCLKYINDVLGHSEGDAALREAALIIREGIGANHLIARIGGDEFVILLKETSESEVHRMIARMREMVRRLDGKKYHFAFNISVGYAFADCEYIPMRELIKTADKAMYKDKMTHLKRMPLRQ